jgi:hypothetical protein
MSEENIVSTSALEQYKYFIDQLASYFATHSILAKRILTEEEVKYSYDYTVSGKEIEELLKLLSHEQQRTLAYLLTEEIASAIHNTLSHFEHQFVSGWNITFNGEPVPIDLVGEGPMQDYVARRLRLWEWPGHVAQTSGLELYKYFIDKLVDFSVTNCILAKQILTDEEFKYIYDPAVRYEDTPDMLKQLSPEQQRTVAHLLIQERDNGIQYTLNLLDELIDKGWRIACHGGDIPTGLFGEGLKGDYISRRTGREWSDD